MAFEQRDNSGALFVNDRKTSDNHPNAKGNAMIDGVEYWVSAWTKTDRNGNRFQSLSFERKDVRRDEPQRDTYREERTARPAETKRPHDDLDDDIPF